MGMDFKRIKKEYQGYREKERKRIIEYLLSKTDDQGEPLFAKLSYKGGSGRPNYGNREERPIEGTYDLSNWKYISTEYKGRELLISLQCFDLDPKSRNIHVLYDRIGVLFDAADIVDVAGTKVSDAFLKMKVSKWELPLEDKDIEALVEWIIKEFN